MRKRSRLQGRTRGWLGWLVMALFVAASAGPASMAGAQEPEPPAEEESEERGWRGRVKSMLTREPDEEEAEEDAESEESDSRGGGDLLMTAMDDPGQPFVIVDPTPAFYFNEWGGGRVPPGGGLRDPVMVAIDRGLVSLEKTAKEKGGNAVLGLRILLENPVDGEEGRVILYGTIVRLLGPEPAVNAP